MRPIDADALIAAFSGGEEMKSMSESIHDERFVEALRNAPTVEIILRSAYIDLETGYARMVVEIGGEKYELPALPVDIKELAQKLCQRENDCETCAHAAGCRHHVNRPSTVRINCPLWRAKG